MPCSEPSAPIRSRAPRRPVRPAARIPPSLASKKRAATVLATTVLAAAALAQGSAPAAAAAQAPLGQSARLFGVHDLSAESIDYLTRATDSCDKGWITHLLYLDGGSHAVTPPRGISLIVRLDWNGRQSAPLDAGERAVYADRFVDTVARSPDVHVWILGNEPNYTISGGFSPLSAHIAPYIEPFVDNYARVRDRLHAVPGHADDLLLLPAPSPWSPCFLEGMARIVRGIRGRGVTVDGFAIHPGTRHPTDAQRAERVTSDVRTPGNCEVGYMDSYDQFRVYRDFVRVADDLGQSDKPIFVTEAAQNTDIATVNHVDEDRGFFAAMYAEIAAWNATHGQRIRALTPYRWERFGDGTGRDHSMRDKPRLLADHARGVVHTWTSPRCDPATPGACRDDGECAGRALCNLESRACTEAPACPCGASELCRADVGACAPRSRGRDTTIAFVPAAPAVGATVRIDVSSPTGYTNIGLRWEGPLGTGGAPAATLVDITPGFHWLYDAPVPEAGTYRATFSSDSGGVVQAIAYLNVGVPASPPEDGGVPGADGGSRPTGDGGTLPGTDAGTDARPPASSVESDCACRGAGAAGARGAWGAWVVVGAATAVAAARRRRRTQGR